ncbi:AAA family ATPase [Vibrio fluvialis]|uniref:Putative type IV pilus assembly FimV-related transmembrane protein n=1 Tax=Vibrio fluvialis PG41 TaxID=1336752 RepID=S7IAX5_VIBFL|nr:FimV/HubP family polar landmark protein [Vibrio fluvialis]EPP25383.1 putative type IV pilus assembly FimV-related transmembrane protein [Vibrio fluvialis PG41]MBY8082507.1 AAA family ATPase [Vibrio fluvialis]MBY8101997.1 AAA family ATPase [Vibrio fluvialis]
MRQFFQRLLLPLAVAAVTQTSIVSAEGIRLIGPSGEVQSSPQFSSEIVRNAASSANSEPSTFFGPTTEQDTLWSIATRLKPSAAVTVQQTLLAIYRLNPQAFENQNIHSLIPGSTLRVPSLAQVNSATTQEAINIMAAHQARLNQGDVKPAIQPAPIAKPQPVVEAKTQQATAKVAETVTVPAMVDTVKPEVEKVEKQIAASDTELVALEEKNHKLRLMVAQMQSEVDNLKQELGDENRIRSEVEKLLQEERVKRDEAQKLAPSALDQLLSNGWMVGLLALIPGLLIGLLVLMLLSRRSKSSSTEPTLQPAQTATPEAAIAPVTVGEPEIDGLDDELLLDDDLFGDTDDSEKLFSDEVDSKDEDDIFADLDESDLDFNLEGEDGQDPFAGIDDDGDLDTEFGSNSGISVNSEEKALGLEEMERALDEATHNTNDDDDEAAFDLSDDGDMSQAEIESLLANDGEVEDLESDAIDQSMLDELLSGFDQEDDTADDLDFDTLLDDNLDELMSDPIERELTQTDVKMTSDEDLESLFNSIESQADLDTLEAEADNFEETALLDELIDEDVTLDSDSTDLLDELIADEDGLDTLELDEDFDVASDKLLNELLDESAPEPSEEFDHNSPTLLDEWVEKEEQPVKTENVASESVEEPVLDDGTEFFEELLEIEQLAQEPTAEFNSDNFKDDLLSSVPEHDPLLEEFNLDDDEESSFEDEAFDFNPEIEGTDSGAAMQPEETPTAVTVPEPIANEFGVPQDDDWLLDEESESTSEIVEDSQPLSSADFMAELDGAENTEIVESVRDNVSETTSASDDNDVERDFFAAELDDESFDFDELELAEDSEEDALADAMAQPELSGEPEAEVKEENLAAEFADAQADDEFEFDDLDLPEYSEEDALADAMAQPELSGEPEAEVKEENLAAEFADAQADDEYEFDDLDLPEYIEEDALADAMAQPELSGEPEVKEEDLAAELADVQAEDESEFDDLELPEYSEEDALADAMAQPELSGESEVKEEGLAADFADAQAEDEFEFDDLELPEYSEEDALADAIAQPELSGEPEVQEEGLAADFANVQAEDEFEFDDLELPEYSEEDALADAMAQPELSGEPEVKEEGLAADFADAQAEDELEFDDLELPEYSEEDALADAMAQPELSGEPEVKEEGLAADFADAQAEDELEFDDLELPEYSEEDALADSIASSVTDPERSVPEAEAGIDFEAMAHQEFDEHSLNSLLDDNEESEGFSFDQPIDAKTIDSAGMDIDAMLQMGGEDWNGFSLTPDQQATIPDEVPEEERAVWQSDIQNQQPEVATENWATQEDLADFDPQEKHFMTIDELMAQVEREETAFNPDDEELKLDVGLNEFPDVIGEISDVDVDSNSEAAGKLDLAKIYMEMNDEKGAVKLLEEAIVDGSDDIRQQAKRLIDVINGRA